MQKVGPFGSPTARIMVVGEAPGQEEERFGRPFYPRLTKPMNAGGLLHKYLLSVGIDPETQVYFTNICKYRPPENKIRGFFNAKGEPNNLVLQGLVELMEEIDRVRPHVIYAAGNYPLWALTQKARWIKVKRRDGSTEWTYSGIGDWRGSILESTLLPGYKVIPSYHPAYILREGMADHGTWTCDLERIAREARFPEIRRPQKELIVDPRGMDRLEARDWLLSEPDNPIMFDIEYLPGANKLICVGMTTDKDKAVVFPTRNSSEIEFCRSILTSGKPLAAQNSIFDCSILEWFHHMPILDKIAYDTMLASHAAQPELPKGLDYLCSIHTDQPFYKNMVSWRDVKAGKQPLSDVYYYNAIDTWVQREVMESQIIHDLSDPAIKRTFNFEMSLLYPLWQMSSRGVRINIEELENLRTMLESEILVMSHVLMSIAGQEVNVKSGPQINALLFEKLGVRPEKMNKTGPANDDKTLASIQAKLDPSSLGFKTIKVIRDIRNRRDLISKFVDVQFDADGRMRGHYDPAGTGTGRLASKIFYPTGTGGNQQNIPRDKRVRKLFLPDIGKLFGYFDLERAESLVVAHLTNDPEMLRVHAPGMDAHKELAAVLFHKPIEEITSDERYIGKTTRHAGNYMEGPLTMMRSVNKDAHKTGVSVTQAECKTYLTAYKNINIMLEPWWDEIENKLWKDRTLYNLMGRRRQFFGHIHSIIPNAVAYIPQSTVGDVLNAGLLNLHGCPCDYVQELGLWETEYQESYEGLKDCGFEPLMQVHDAIGFQIDEDKAERGLPLVAKLMSIPLVAPKTGDTFRIPVESLAGPSWGGVKLWEAA